MFNVARDSRYNVGMTRTVAFFVTAVILKSVFYLQPYSAQHVQTVEDVQACPKGRTGVKTSLGKIFCYHFESTDGITDIFRANELCKKFVENDETQSGGMSPLLTHQELLYMLQQGQSSSDVIAIGMHSPGYLYEAVKEKLENYNSEQIYDLYQWTDYDVYSLSYWNQELQSDVQTIIKQNYTGNLLRHRPTLMDTDRTSEDWCLFLVINNHSATKIRDNFHFTANKLYDAPCADLFSSLHADDIRITIACREYKLIDSCKFDGGKSRCLEDRSYECVNTLSGYSCNCREGYFLDISSQRAACKDINECAPQQSVCQNNADCENIPGSFMCKCSSGYTGDKCEIIRYDIEGNIETWQILMIVLAFAIALFLLFFFIIIFVKRRQIESAPPVPIYPSFVSPSTSAYPPPSSYQKTYRDSVHPEPALFSSTLNRSPHGSGRSDTGGLFRITRPSRGAAISTGGSPSITTTSTSTGHVEVRRLRPKGVDDYEDSQKRRQSVISFQVPFPVKDGIKKDPLDLSRGSNQSDTDYIEFMKPSTGEKNRRMSRVQVMRNVANIPLPQGWDAGNEDRIIMSGQAPSTGDSDMENW